MSASLSAILAQARPYWRPASLYAAAIAALVATGVWAWAGALESWSGLQAARAAQEQLSGRLGRGGAGFSAQPPAGSPFLEGASLTIAGANLQQRVALAVAQAGGTVLSSQVDLAGARAAQGHVGLIVTCDLSSNGLQKALYDLESGSPVLIVDQLVVQTAQAEDAARRGQMRVQIGVSGRWAGAK